MSVPDIVPQQWPSVYERVKEFVKILRGTRTEVKRERKDNEDSEDSVHDVAATQPPTF